MDTENNSHEPAAEHLEHQSNNNMANTNWKGIGIAFSALALIILFGVTYFGMARLIHINQTLSNTIAEVDAQVSGQQSVISTLQTDTQETKSNLTSYHDELSKQQDVLGDLRKSYQAKNDTWTVAEANYLVKMANANLQLGENIPLIINLLQTANSELQSLTDPNVVAIRKALAADILSLQGVANVDVTGIYMQINALNGDLDKLPLVVQRPTELASTETPAEQKWWQRGWQQTLNSLKKIVVVRYNQDGVAPLILPDQQQFLFQNIHAMFEQAMSAVVQQQPDIYRASLANADVWVKKYFQNDASETKAALASIEKLQTINIRPTLPTLSATLQAFHDYAAQQKDQLNAGAANSGKSA
jgi:uroporphyrin-3 C-methyltransferase